MNSDEDQAQWDKDIDEFKACKTFEELHLMHLDWICGRRKGYHFSGMYKLDSLDGSDDFIDLLKFVSQELKMITTNSQPSLRVFQSEVNKPRGINGFPSGVLDKIDQVEKFEILFRPYITGLVTRETFEKVFQLDQTELVILGTWHCGYDSKNIENILSLTNVTQPAKFALMKNTTIDDKLRGFSFTKNGFYFKGEEPKYSNSTGFWYHNYDYEESNHLHNTNTGLFELTITHKDFGIEPSKFEALIKDLIKDLIKKISG